MKCINSLFLFLFLSATLFSSCGKNNAPLISIDYGCEGLRNTFEEQKLAVQTAADNYAGNPTSENCMKLKVELESYTLAITAITAVEYCVEEEGEEFVGFILSELIGTQELLDQLGDCK